MEGAKKMSDRNYEKLRFDTLEKMIRELGNSVNEIKTDIKELFRSDRRQENELVRLEMRIEFNEKAIKESIQSQKDHDKSLYDKIEELKEDNKEKINAVADESRNDWKVFFKVTGFLLAGAAAAVGIMKAFF